MTFGNEAQGGFWEKYKSFSLKKYGIMILFAIGIFILSLLSDSFFTAVNLLNILRQSAVVGLIAIGSTFVIIGGGFDICVGSLLALSAAMALGLQEYMPWYYAIVIVLVMGAAAGFVNGFLTAKIKIVAIITTLGTMTILRGLTYLYTGGSPKVGIWEDFNFIGSGYIGPIPFPIIILLIMVIFWQFILSKTKLGRYACAVGGNKEAARLSGVPVDFYHIMTFVIGGVMAAMAGIVYASRINSANPTAGDGYELDAIAATVIGGTSVSGGEGSIVRTLIGVLLLNVIINAFTMFGLGTSAQKIIKGVIILVVVGIDSYSKSKQ
ncbi:MAG: ABC transporter permease [Desulfobacteraceae bacterium]|nr:MAG: ABC transporter permease [Desulfobacteraceae bacterium]